MNESIDIDLETIKAEAFRKIGRNISNLAKIEAGLKYLLSVSSFEGPVQSIPDQFQINQIKDGKHSKKTLGSLVKEFHKSVLVDGSESEPIRTFPNLEPNLEFYMSLNFNVTCDDPNLLDLYKSAFLVIVDERNKLIHQDLAFFDISVENCRNMISFLDEQNPRLLERLEDLRSMIKGILETMNDGVKILTKLLVYRFYTFAILRGTETLALSLLWVILVPKWDAP